jgi:hypothetical protein
MTFLFTLAQLADAATMRPAFEANRLVLILGDSAFIAKVLLIVLVLATAYALRQGRYRWVRGWLLGIGTVVGFCGFWTNIA